MKGDAVGRREETQRENRGAPAVNDGKSNQRSMEDAVMERGNGMGGGGQAEEKCPRPR